MYGVFAVCLIAFLVINRPERLEKAWEADKNQTLSFDHGMILVRILILLAYILGLLYFAYWG
jgi:hypothetical protein